MPISVRQSDSSQPPQVAMIPGIQNAMGFQQVTATGSAFSLTVPNGAQFALIQAQTQGLVWRDDGTNPTATVGMVIPAGAELMYNVALSKIKLIAQTAGAVANISYYA